MESPSVRRRKHSRTSGAVRGSTTSERSRSRPSTLLAKVYPRGGRDERYQPRSAARWEPRTRASRFFSRCACANASWMLNHASLSGVEYLESGVDAALLVGMHAMAGTRDGVLAHTVSGSSWWRLCFNGIEVGETGINAALCGTWGCPVVLVTGDEASCREGVTLLGDGLTTVAVKKGLDRFSARQFPALTA